MQTKNFKLFSILVSAAALTFFSILLSSCDDSDPAPAPVADFTHVVDEVTGLTVTFTNTSENGVSYAWTFGVAGATSTVESPEYTYPGSGAYTVTLSVTNVDGVTVTKSKTIALTAIPQNLLVNSNFVNNASWTLSDGHNNPETGDWSGASDLVFENGLTIRAVYDNAGEVTRSNFSLYQAVELEAGTYEIRSDATLADVGDAWFFASVLDFELDAANGETPPEDDDEGAFTVLAADIASDECKTYTGSLEDMPCLSDSFIKTGKADGVFEISTAGTYYFVITAGQWESTFGTFKINNIGLYKIL